MPSGYFQNRPHVRMESVDRGAVYNLEIQGFPQGIPEGYDPYMLAFRVSSQNPQDCLVYAFNPAFPYKERPGRDYNFIIPQTLKVFPKSMSYVHVEGSGDNVTIKKYINNDPDSIFCTDWDYGFPEQRDPDTDIPTAWEPGCRYVGGLFVDQSQNNPL